MRGYMVRIEDISEEGIDVEGQSKINRTDVHGGITFSGLSTGMGLQG